QDANSLSVRPGNGMGQFGAQTTYATGTTPVSIGHGTFDDDDQVDVAVADFASATVTVFLGAGGGILQNEGQFGVGMEPCVLAVAVLGDDGRDDVVLANRHVGSVSILRSSPMPFAGSSPQCVG